MKHNAAPLTQASSWLQKLMWILGDQILIPFPVPTSTVIARVKGDPYKVYVIEQSTKHNGGLTFVGGRCTLPGQKHRTCIFEEWDQEAGGLGASLENVTYWATRTDRNSEPRNTTLGRVTDNQCPRWLRDLPVRGLYGSPDVIFIADVVGTPFPKDGEAKRCLVVDVRDVVIDKSKSGYGAKHDRVLALYRLWLEGRKVTHDDLADMDLLADMLLQEQSKRCPHK